MEELKREGGRGRIGPRLLLGHFCPSLTAYKYSSLKTVSLFISSDIFPSREVLFHFCFLLLKLLAYTIYIMSII